MTSRSRCNSQCAPAISWGPFLANERPAPVASRCHGELAFWTRAGVQGLHALCAMPDDQARETHSTSLLKRVFGLEIPVSGNGRALRGQRDQQPNRRWRLPRAVCLLLAERCQREDFVWENANQAKRR